MSAHNQDELRDDPVETEVLDPSQDEIAEISPSPDVSHGTGPDDHPATDTTAVVPEAVQKSVLVRPVKLGASAAIPDVTPLPPG